MILQVSPFAKGKLGGLACFRHYSFGFQSPLNIVQLSRHSGMDRRNPDCRACPGMDRRGMPTIHAVHGA